ncbi:hypothetical protein BDV93DRAFT_186744 [Ceratobasidium sp. AG-I]|nr:hypothetical protein BDV93DRAFT_186744 [Ceratobasidium sp. AG-I]
MIPPASFLIVARSSSLAYSQMKALQQIGMTSEDKIARIKDVPDTPLKCAALFTAMSCLFRYRHHKTRIICRLRFLPNSLLGLFRVFRQSMIQ